MAAADAYFSFSRAHAEAVRRGMGHDEALGYALAAELTAREPVVERDALLAGMPGSLSLVRLNVNGLTCADAVPAELLGTGDEAEARETIALWQPRTTAARFGRALEEEFSEAELCTLREPSLGWGGGWGGHAVLGYERVLRDGVSGLAARVDEGLRRAETEGADAAALDWYRGLAHVCRGIREFVANHAARATELAERAVDAEERRHYAAIAEACTRVATDGARDLRDAVQLFWFVHVLDDTDSPGRIDQFLLPYYHRLPGDAAARREAAWPILSDLWRRLIRCRSWNVCLAGQTPAGHDATNELTWLFLDLQAHYRAEAPNLSVRWFAGSPPELLRRCAAVIALGTGLPALYNDEVLVPALTDLGIPLDHARDYALNGCMQVDIQGLSHMGLEDGELNLAKCLELALHAGRSPVTGRQTGAATVPVEQIGDVETLQAQLRRQIEHCAGLLVRSSNTFQRVVAESGPHLFRSLFIDPCVDRGRDIRRGGPLYNHGQFLTEGLANTGDALYAIDQLVFRERRMSLAELVAILDANWEGHEDLRRYALQRVDKFGNGCAEVDALTSAALETYFRFLRTQRTWRGGVYSGGLSTFNRAPGYGERLAASADGRVKGETVADSCGPMRGRDRRGPTAMMRSAARLPHRLAASGFALNLRLSPSLFEGPEGCGKVAALFETYFRMGGQQLQVNVVSAARLRAAQADPAANRDVIVRVGGFSARFVDLSRALQDDVVARTEHA